MMAERTTPSSVQTIYFFSDCQGAIHAATSPDILKSLSSICSNIKRLATSIDTNITIYWVAGHANVEGNERADKMAKEGATRASSECDTSLIESVPATTAKKKASRSTDLRWKEKWLRQKPDDAIISKLQPGRKYRSVHSRQTEVAINRLVLGHCNLNNFMHKILPDAYPTPMCTCNTEIETPEHFIKSCPLYNAQRTILYEAIDQAYEAHDTPQDDRNTDITTLLGLTKTDNNIARRINEAMGNFIEECLKNGKNL